MNVERYTFDTNVLLFYALVSDAAGKYELAARLIGIADPGRAVVLLPTLAELYNSVRRRRPDLTLDVHRWVRRSTVCFDVISVIPADLEEAIPTQQQRKLPFWDAMLWGYCPPCGCTLLLT